MVPIFQGQRLSLGEVIQAPSLAASQNLRLTSAL